jgi:hypothetical protein
MFGIFTCYFLRLIRVSVEIMLVMTEVEVVAGLERPVI